MQPHCLKFFSVKYGSGYIEIHRSFIALGMQAWYACTYILTVCLARYLSGINLVLLKFQEAHFRQIQCGRIAKTRRGNFLPFMFLPICICKDFESQRQLFRLRTFWVIVSFFCQCSCFTQLFREMSNLEIVKVWSTSCKQSGPDQAVVRQIVEQ